MRTTVRLDDDLLRRARRVAAERGKTLTSLIEEALRQLLAGRHSSGKRTVVRLPTFKGGGQLPDLDLDDTVMLLDVMERSD